MKPGPAIPIPAGLVDGGWFIESLFTQVLVVLVIRTRRSPFSRSRPSSPLLAAIVGRSLRP